MGFAQRFSPPCARPLTSARGEKDLVERAVDLVAVSFASLDLPVAVANNAARDGSPSYLDKIVAQRRLDVAAAKASVSEDALRAQIAAQSPVHDFVAALRRQELAVLAEMKRASPSKGDIAVGVDAAQQGLTYALAGACTVSVLTCPTGLGAARRHGARAPRARRGGARAPVCVLRKDFVIDAYQLLEVQRTAPTRRCSSSTS